MLSTLFQARRNNALVIQLALVLAFAALTALTARIKIDLPFTPVPITLQVFAVLLAGLTLGARQGAASQLVYCAAIAAGLPIDANGLGTGAWFTPTAGYLIGFVLAAFVAGWLTERGLHRSRLTLFVAALAGVCTIYICGALWLTLLYLGGDWSKGWALGIAPFIVVDGIKALVAAGLAWTLREGFLRTGFLNG